jgi:hypothetical protein
MIALLAASQYALSPVYGIIKIQNSAAKNYRVKLPA